MTKPRTMAGLPDRGTSPLTNCCHEMSRRNTTAMMKQAIRSCFTHSPAPSVKNEDVMWKPNQQIGLANNRASLAINDYQLLAGEKYCTHI
ncbi:hypothetical protein FHT03_001072 [Xanthomonas arboricola]